MSQHWITFSISWAQNSGNVPIVSIFTTDQSIEPTFTWKLSDRNESTNGNVNKMLLPVHLTVSVRLPPSQSIPAFIRANTNASCHSPPCSCKHLQFLPIWTNAFIFRRPQAELISIDKFPQTVKFVMHILRFPEQIKIHDITHRRMWRVVLECQRLLVKGTAQRGQDVLLTSVQFLELLLQTVHATYFLRSLLGV